VPLGEKAFECADLNRTINLASPAGCLARMSADASADAGQWVGIPRESVSFLETAFRDQRYVPPGVRMSRASHHAREVGIQPVPIHRFIDKSFLHDDLLAIKPDCRMATANAILLEFTAK